MTVSVIMDIVIAAVFLLCVVLGWRRGLFRSLAELAVVILALVLSCQFADFAAPLVIDRGLRPATHEAISRRVDEMMAEDIAAISPVEELERVVDAIPNDFIREQAKELIGGLGLSVEETLEHSAREHLLELGTQTADTVLDTVVYSLMHTLLCFAAFLVLTLALRLVARALDLTLRLPVLHQANQVGGLLFGAVKGLVLVCLGVWLLGQAGLWVTPESVEDSRLLKIVAAWVGLIGHPVV